jgi:hypothetical protein
VGATRRLPGDRVASLRLCRARRLRHRHLYEQLVRVQQPAVDDPALHEALCWREYGEHVLRLLELGTGVAETTPFEEVTAAQLYSSACAARSACVRRLLQQPLAALTAQQLAQQLAHDGALEVDAEALVAHERVQQLRGQSPDSDHPSSAAAATGASTSASASAAGTRTGATGGAVQLPVLGDHRECDGRETSD